ncbi:hypothetical protein PILCRDRAFT_7023 [Piloderma croceum F 1598]|uniref:Uncharacterized protein n=1 Tax=Piloderma croceum (strain F 1598) TaxID=765440 RepID=A0A0C3FH18_PILCF|nr:hypothetical protein PILCRDRAFT_7023 [Piloderma croceum F 1598]
MFTTLLLITVPTILTYLLLITQPTFHRRSYRYLGDEIRGYESIRVVDDTTTSSYGIPIETSPLISESRIINQQLVEQRAFHDAEESLPNVQRVSSPISANRPSTIQRPQSPPVVVDRVRSPAPAN